VSAELTAISRKQAWILAGVVLAGFLLRLHVVLGSTYHWDEEREWIPFARDISLEPGNVNLPIRAISHPILPAYLIRLGSLLGGDNPFGYRLMSALAGALTVLVIAAVALSWRGFAAAFWAASLLAFNEYHIYVSSLAIDKPFQLFFAALAVAGFSRFLQTENVRALYFAGLMTGVAFLCKETTGLLLPGFLAAMLLSGRHRVWFRRAAPYVAVLIFVVVISPDLVINFLMRDDLEFSYSDHLQRAAGPGFTRHHLLFFLRGAIQTVYGFMGQSLSDLAPEYASMNSLLGTILLGVASIMAVRIALSRDVRQDATSLYLTIAFWAVFGFFLFVEVSTEGAIQHLIYVAWFWSDLTLIPGCILAGAFLVGLMDKWRPVGYSIAGLAVALAIADAVFTRVGTPKGPVVAFAPEYILPPDGRRVSARGSINYCAICEKNMSARIVGVELRHPDGATEEALGAGYARIDRDSESGLGLVLLARDGDPAENPDERWNESMWYDITLELTDSAGSTYLVEDRVFSSLIPSEFNPPFWSVPKEQELRR